MTKTIIAVAVLGLLTGCATATERYSEKWVGRPLSDRIAVKGNPDAELPRLDGQPGKVYRWITAMQLASTPTYQPATVVTSTGTVATATVPVAQEDLRGTCKVDMWVSPENIIEKVVATGLCK